MLHLFLFGLLAQLAVVALAWLAAELAVLLRGCRVIVVPGRRGEAALDAAWAALTDVQTRTWMHATWRGGEGARWN